MRLLGGFSPALLKLLVEGDSDDGAAEEAVTQADKAAAPRVKRAKLTSYETLRKCLDDAAYHPVRDVLAQCQEGQLAGYEVAEEVRGTAQLVQGGMWRPSR